jgi:hypothetical protein
MRWDEQDEREEILALARREIGAEVDEVLGQCIEHHALQGEVAQIAIVFVRERLNAIFVSQEDDD